ncbi:hypothetical protein DYB38_003475 [Aphanomyces astaci]|uniref:Uncharacterized protein n=1 Tax=Aphanomyces astaci TaxID=112090 RepID=A0A397DM40_APHAT|nr:hypothetical protein DYB38_003475 [Aphanomyces astaci]
MLAWRAHLSHDFVAAGHQTRTYYRTGEADTCDGRWSDVWRCFRANQMDAEKAKEYLKDTNLDPAKKQHVATVWNLKQTPGW